MKIRTFLIWAMLLTACATPKAVRFGVEITSTEEQCRILYEKRNVTPKHARNTVRTFRRPFSRDAFIAEAETGSPSLPNAVTTLSAASTTVTIPLTGTETFPPALTAQMYPKQERNHQFSLPAGDVAFSEEKGFAEELLRADDPSPSVTPLQGVSTPTLTIAVPAMLGAASLLAICLLYAGRPRSKRLSRWAVRNPWKARALIVGAHTFTGISMVALGNGMAEGNIMISEVAKYAAFVAFGTSFLLYPDPSKSSHFSRTFHHTILFTTGAVLALCASNRYCLVQQATPNEKEPLYTFITLDSQNPVYIVERDFSANARPLQDTPDKSSRGEKILLTILAVVLFAVLAFGVGALSCNIACAGNEGLAYFVFFGGMTGLIFLLVRAIKSIFGKRKKDRRANRLGDDLSAAI